MSAEKYFYKGLIYLLMSPVMVIGFVIRFICAGFTNGWNMYELMAMKLDE